MTQNVYIKLTLAGTDTGPFDLYSDIDGYTVPFEIGISKSSLLSGYTSSLVPVGSSAIEVKSTGACTTYATASITGLVSTPVITPPITYLINLTSITNQSSTIYGSHGDLVWEFNTQLSMSLARFEISIDGGSTWIYTSPNIDVTAIHINSQIGPTTYFSYNMYNFLANGTYYFRVTGITTQGTYSSNILSLTINVSSATSSVHNISPGNGVAITLTERPMGVNLLNSINFIDDERKNITPIINNNNVEFYLFTNPANSIISGTVSMFIHPYNTNLSVPLTIDQTLTNASVTISGVDLSTPPSYMDPNVKVHFDVETSKGCLVKIYHSSSTMIGNVGAASVLLYYKIGNSPWEYRNVTLYNCNSMSSSPSTSPYFSIRVPYNILLRIGMMADNSADSGILFAAQTSTTSICSTPTLFSGITDPFTIPISSSQNIYLAAKYGGSGN